MTRPQTSITSALTVLRSTAVNHPNGLALSEDGETLYVAQIFTNIRPVVSDNTIWSMALKDGNPVKDANIVVRAGPNASPDGLAMDSEGRLYIAANREGNIWRVPVGVTGARLYR